MSEIRSAEGILASGHVNRINRPSTWLRDVEILLANPESFTHGAPKIIHDSVDSEFAPYLIRGTAGRPVRPICTRSGDNRKARQGDVRENLRRDEVRAVANLTIGTPQNLYSASQSSNAPSAPGASAQWSAVVWDLKAAGNGGQLDQTTTTKNGAELSHIGTTNNGGQPNQTGTPGQTAHQKPAGGSSWSLWIHGGLTAGSFLPSFVGAGFSAADGIVYSVERDRTNAALSFGAAGVGLFTDAGVVKAAALGLGVASKALKVGEAAVKVEKEANSVVKVGEAVVTAEKEVNTAAKVGEAAKPVAAQSATAVDSGATSIRKVDRRPAWLKKRVEAGQQFDRVNRHRYPVNELEVTDKAGNKFRLDSHHPQKGEIVSRKFTPLSEVKRETGIGYLREMLRKYPPGARISESRFNPKTLRGQLLTGNLILEVPVQKSTVPKAVLDYANKYGIVIRDVNGVRYR